MELGTEEKTILHYGKKISEYCKSHMSCKECAIANSFYFEGVIKYRCYFNDIPEKWEEINLHE